MDCAKISATRHSREFDGPMVVGSSGLLILRLSARTLKLEAKSPTSGIARLGLFSLVKHLWNLMLQSNSLPRSQDGPQLIADFQPQYPGSLFVRTGEPRLEPWC